MEMVKLIDKDVVVLNQDDPAPWGNLSAATVKEIINAINQIAESCNNEYVSELSQKLKDEIIRSTNKDDEHEKTFVSQAQSIGAAQTAANTAQTAANTTNSNLTTHTQDTAIHTTAAQKAAWDGKVNRSGDTMTGPLRFLNSSILGGDFNYVRFGQQHNPNTSTLPESCDVIINGNLCVGYDNPSMDGDEVVINRNDRTWRGRIGGTNTGPSAGLLRTDSAGNISRDTNTYITSAQVQPVNNGTLTIQKNGTTFASFTANQGTNTTANIFINLGDVRGGGVAGMLDDVFEEIPTDDTINGVGWNLVWWLISLYTRLNTLIRNDNSVKLYRTVQPSNDTWADVWWFTHFGRARLTVDASYYYQRGTGRIFDSIITPRGRPTATSAVVHLHERVRLRPTQTQAGWCWVLEVRGMGNANGFPGFQFFDLFMNYRS